MNYLSQMPAPLLKRLLQFSRPDYAKYNYVTRTSTARTLCCPVTALHVEAAPTPSAVLSQPVKGTASDSATSEPFEWPGLLTWRGRGVDRGLVWGDDGPEPNEPTVPPMPQPGSLFEAGLQVLTTADPAAKCAITHSAWLRYNEGHLPMHPRDGSRDAIAALPRPPARPARPEKPRLVAPKQVRLLYGVIGLLLQVNCS